MKRKQLTAILCVIILIIAAVTVVSATNIIGGKKTDENGKPDTGENDTPNESDTPNENDTPNESDTPDESNKPDTNNTPDENDKPDTNENDTSDGSGKPNDGGSGSKSFSLTSGMSAAQAYEYLDSFLSSKYSILINKQHKVGSDYAPDNLTVPAGCDYQMEQTAAKALTNMLAAARADGYSDLILYSGYRTYASQKNKFETRTQRYLNEGYSQAQAEEKAGEYIAPPGSSEHHTGLAADVCSSKIVSKFGYLDDSFDSTDEYKWLKEHCAEYGFIMRYRKDAEDITGFLYEPWHYRYIGVDHAKACTELSLTYEEYYEMLEKMRDEAKAEAGL